MIVTLPGALFQEALYLDKDLRNGRGLWKHGLDVLRVAVDVIVFVYIRLSVGRTQIESPRKKPHRTEAARNRKTSLRFRKNRKAMNVRSRVNSERKVNVCNTTAGLSETSQVAATKLAPDRYSASSA